MSTQEAFIRGRTALVLDAEPAVSTCIARLLSKSGFLVLQADSLFEAELLALRCPELELLVVDCSPRTLKGTPLFDFCRVSRPNLRLLLTSAEPCDIPLETHLGTSPVVCLAKPFSQTELVAALTEVMDSSPPNSPLPSLGSRQCAARLPWAELEV